MDGRMIYIHSQARMTAKCIFSARYVFCSIWNPTFLSILKHQSLLVRSICT